MLASCLSRIVESCYMDHFDGDIRGNRERARVVQVGELHAPSMAIELVNLEVGLLKCFPGSYNLGRFSMEWVIYIPLEGL